MKLRTKFGAALVLITLVLSGATYGGLEFYKTEEVDRTEADVGQTAERAADQIDAAIVGKRDYVAYVAQSRRATNFDRSGELLVGILANSRFITAQLVDANGTVVDAQGPYSPARRRELVGSDARSDGCVNRTLVHGDTCTSLTDGSSRPLLVVSAPVFVDGNVGGALVAAIVVDGRTFFSTLEPLETGSQAVVVTHDEAVLYERHERFERRIAESAEVASTGWVVTVERDRSRLDDQLRGFALAQGLGIFLVMATIVGFGTWEYSANLRQTERLLAGFQDIVRGKYDRTLSLTTGDEWRQISEGFNELVEELERREVALREREQRLEVLNRVLRHNVRNEMNIILSYADLLADETDDETVAEMAETVSAAGQRLVNVGENARRAEAVLGGPRAAEPVDLTRLASDAVAEVESAHPDVDVETSMPEKCWIRGASALSHAIENVVENACRYNDGETSSVTVTLDVAPAPDGRDVRLRVVDDGPGIPEHEYAVLEEGRETPLEHGSGLGLWLAYWLADRCDGVLEFGENDPRGAVVEFRFVPSEPPAEE